MENSISKSENEEDSKENNSDSRSGSGSDSRSGSASRTNSNSGSKSKTNSNSISNRNEKKNKKNKENTNSIKEEKEEDEKSGDSKNDSDKSYISTEEKVTDEVVAKSTDLPFKFKCKQTIKAHNSEVTCMILIKTTNEIATGGMDFYINIWGIPKGRNKFLLSAKLNGHTNAILSLAEFTNLDCICSTSVDKTLKLWDLKTLKCFATLAYHDKSVLSSAYRPSGRYEIFSGSDDSTIVVWEDDEKFHYNPKYILKGHKKGVVCIIYLNKKGYLISGSDDKAIRIWDAFDEYKCIKTITSLKSEINCLRYAKNRLMASCVDGTINFINLKIMKRVRSVQFSSYAVYDFQLLDKEKYLLVASCDCRGRVWGIGTKQRAILEGHDKPLSSIIQLKNGDIVTASLDNTIKVWALIDDEADD